MATPKMAGHSHLTLVLPNRVETKFSPQEKNTNIANSSGINSGRELGANKVSVGNYHEYLSQFIQAAITSQSRHPGDHIRGLWSPPRDVTRGPRMHRPRYDPHLYYSMFVPPYCTQ